MKPAGIVALVCYLFCASAAEAKTWALLIGVSQYRNLPHDLWLQYADTDAQSLSSFFGSVRGGTVPASQIRLLTNSNATAAAVRSAFHEFLKESPGRNDTVYIAIAAHGTVDSTGAWILTYDSDPQDLSHTSIAMSELRTLVERELAVAGRVVLLADVCRAAAIAGQKSSSVAGAVEELGEVPGELLGLMAARPKELSNEGPQFGSGHGAFTWSVLKGLEGAADADHDGLVTAGELIDYVSADVPKTTGGTQHPRDFGNMDNATRLAGLPK